MSNWQLQDAKARLSEVVKRAAQEGPQHITVRGKPAAVVLSEADYQRLTETNGGFIDFIRNSPLAGVELDLTRNPSMSRKVSLSARRQR